MAKSVAIAEQHKTGLDALKTAPARLGDFLRDVRSEMKKVVTPSRQEVQSTTIVVIVTVFIFAAYFAIIDSAVGHTFDLLLKKLTSQ